MQLYNFLLVKRSILLIIFSIILFSCGTYQYSGNISDGIYDENKKELRKVGYIHSQQESNQELVYDKEIKNSYYQTIFSEKSMQYEETEPLNDSIFTDTESYQGLAENDTIKKNYAPWGEDIDHLTINLYRGPAYNSIYWSRLWNYPIWLNNYGYGYGSAWNTWGYGYNNYWLRPYHYGGFGGYYNDFFNPWGWGGYGHPFYYSHYNYYNYPYFQNQWNNTSIAYISGGRRSRNATSLRSGYANNTSRIGNRVNNLSSSSLKDRISRIDRINSAARVKPSYYSKPVSNYNSGYKPNSTTTKPSSNYNYKPSGYKPSSNSNPSNNSKPSYNSSPSFKPSGSSGGSRPSSSGSSGSSRSGGKSGGRSGGH